MDSFGQKGSQINKNEFNKIVDQNIKLKKELLIANKCIETFVTFKSFIDFISNKFKNNLNSNEWQKFEKLRRDVEEVLKTEGNCIKRTTNKLSQNKVSSEDVIDIDEEILYKSNITYKRRKQSNSCSQYKQKPVNKLTEETTDPTTVQTIKTEIISNDKTEETYNSLNLSESQFSTKAPNNEQNIGFVDTNVGSKECSENRRISVGHRLLRPIINIKPSNTSTDPKINPVFKCPIIGCNKWMTIDFIPKHSLEIHKQFVVICDQINCNKVFTSSAKYEEHMTLPHRKDKQLLIVKSVDKSNESTDEMTDPITTQTIKTEIISNDKTEENSENISFQYLTQNLIDFENTYNSLNLSESQLSTKGPNNEQNIGFVDINVDFEESNESINEELKVKDPNECDICGKLCANKQSLKQHKKFVHILKPNLKCDFPGCEVMFKYPCHLNVHRSTVHSSIDLKLKCNQCNKVFRNQKALNDHKIVHSGKLFACNWSGCEFRTHYKQHLKPHERSHIL